MDDVSLERITFDAQTLETPFLYHSRSINYIDQQNKQKHIAYGSHDNGRRWQKEGSLFILVEKNQQLEVDLASLDDFGHIPFRGLKLHRSIDKS